MARSTPGNFVKIQALQQPSNEEVVDWQVEDEIGYLRSLGSSIPPCGWLETPAAQCKGRTWQGVPGAAAAPGGHRLSVESNFGDVSTPVVGTGTLQVRLEEAEPLRLSPGYLHTSSEPGSHLPVKVHSLVIQKIKSTGGPHEQCYTKPQTTSEPAKQLSCWDKLRF